MRWIKWRNVIDIPKTSEHKINRTIATPNDAIELDKPVKMQKNKAKMSERKEDIKKIKQEKIVEKEWNWPFATNKILLTH